MNREWTVGVLIGVTALVAAACSSPPTQGEEATQPTLAEPEGPGPPDAGPAPCGVPPDPTDHGCLGRGTLRWDLGPRSGLVEFVPRDAGATAFTSAYYRVIADRTHVSVTVNDPAGRLQRLTANWVIGEAPDFGWLTMTALGPEGDMGSWLAEADDSSAVSFADGQLTGTVSGELTDGRADETTILYAVTFDLTLDPGVVVQGED